MSTVLAHWSFDPFIVMAAVTVVVHEVGLRRLAARSEPRRVRQRRGRSLLFYAGLLVLLLAVSSPIDYWAASYFYVHMIEHILIMFFAPMLIVAGAPWVPLMHALPVRARRAVGRAVILDPRFAPARGAWRILSAPWTALISLNAVMLVWHLPAAFDLAERTGFVHIWAMHGSFFVTGMLFWLQIIPSRPFRRRASAIWQIGAIFSTNVAMFVLAMALSIFTNHSWYSVYAHVPGVSLSPFADQQIGAAILWICGDFWAVPSLSLVVRRAMEEEGSLSGVLDAMIGRAAGSARRFGAAALVNPAAPTRNGPNDG